MESDQVDRDNEAEARMKIQDIINELHDERLSLIDPKSICVDDKMKKLDQLFEQYFEDETAGANENKSVNASQARLDIEAFSMLAVINHTRIRAVTACSWSFRAADFASRIIKQCNHEDRESEEGLSTDGVKRLQTIIAPYWNSCAPVRPLLGALSLLPTEVVQREKKPRQPREKMDREAAKQQKPLKVSEITEDDQNTKVAKHVEFIMRCFKKERATRGKPISYFHFVVDPNSFSNTVENIFYVSFLIKDGFVALKDENGLPMLDMTPKGSRQEIQSQSQQSSTAKKQLIISVDYDLWQVLVATLQLQRAAIDQESKSRHVQKRPRQN